MITASLLRAVMPRAGTRADVFAPFLETARAKWVGDDPLHVAMWLAQLAHESGELRYTLELADGTAYEGRADLGNTEPGDGPRFRGRGLIQLTGRHNYGQAGLALGLPLLDAPELLQQPEHAAAVAGWFWSWSGCAVRMQESNPLEAVTRRINGGLNGLENRRQYWERAKQVLTSAAPVVESQPVLDKEKPVAPIIAAVLPALVQAIPELTKIFGSGSQVAERNARAAEKVVELVTTATQSVNVQQATERVVTDPAARALAQEAVRREYFELAQMTEKSVAAAREFNKGWGDGVPFIRTTWLSLHFVEFLSLLLVLLAAVGGYLVLTEDTFSAEIKSAVVTLILIGGFTAVQTFWLGSSRDSQRKTEMLGK